MKISKNSKYFTVSFYAFCTIVLSALAILMIFNFDKVSEKLALFTAVATPIIIGIFCAYLLNPLMMKFERGLFKKWSNSNDPKARAKARGFSLTITMVVVLVGLSLIVLLIIPQLITNLITIFNNMDNYINTAKNFIDKISQDNPLLAEFIDNPLDNFGKWVSGLWSKYSSELLGFAGNIASGVWSVIDTLKNVFIGLTISIYLLAKKEMFVGQAKKFLFACVKAETAQRIIRISKRASEKFLGSIVGKIIESFLVAVLIFAGCIALRMPYAPLLSVIMFVFNLIPAVGPIIGCVPCCLLLLLSGNVMPMIWFIVLVTVIQTIDGNIICPWILGDQTGLPAVWIFIAIVIGGGFFGVIGMLLGVPVCAVIYMLLKDITENRLKKKKLPYETEQYVGNVDYITPDYVYEESELPHDEISSDEKKNDGKINPFKKFFKKRDLTNKDK